MKKVVLGAVCGLAWAGGLRGYMTELVGQESKVTWSGTEGALLLPGAVVGGLLGWAEELRQSGRADHRRALIAAPLLLPLAPFALPWAVKRLLTTAEGSGATAVSIIGYAGAHALAGRGSPWLRAASGATALSIVPLWALSSKEFGDGKLDVSTPRGAWVALHFFALLGVLAVATSIPLRMPKEGETPQSPDNPASGRDKQEHGGAG